MHFPPLFQLFVRSTLPHSHQTDLSTLKIVHGPHCSDPLARLSICYILMVLLHPQMDRLVYWTTKRSITVVHFYHVLPIFSQVILIGKYIVSFYSHFPYPCISSIQIRAIQKEIFIIGTQFDFKCLQLIY